MVSLTMVAASTTVGTPIARTGIPTVSFVMALRWFPTPEPGLIPVSEIWMVRLSLLELLAARASTAIIISGFVSRTMPLMISTVSIPVCAMTPGTIALTKRTFSSPMAYFPYSFTICLVIFRLSTT